MPTVPTYDSAQVLPGISPAPYRQSQAPDTAIGARQMGALGETVQNVGAFLSQEEVNAQGMANQVMVDGAKNQALQEQLARTYDPDTGFLNKKGAAALAPDPLGRSLSQRYTEEFQDKLKEISGGLGNDAQRRVFNEQAASMATSFGGDVQRHMLQEHRIHQDETQQGTIKLAADAAKLAWNAPDKIDEQVQSASSAVWKLGQLHGEPANLTAAKIKDTTSAIHSGVIMAALQNNNPEYALGYIEKNKDGMTADDLLKARGVVNKDAYERIADGVATRVVDRSRLKMTPTDGDRMVAITEQTESGGNRDAVGKFIPGQGTAKGSMQVMDATAKNPGFGIKPVADDSPEERARVGRELVPALVKNYAGDAAKAWAAYNAGAGTVDKAIAAAKKNGTGWSAEMANFQSPENFKETQNYVAKNVAALQKGGGVAAKPTLLEVHDGVRAEITAKFGATPPPGVLKLALNAATSQFEDLSKSIKAGEDAAVVDAMRALPGVGGRVSMLPYDVRSRIPADKLDNVIAFGEKIAKGDDITNPAVYQRLSDPVALRKLTDNEFYKLRAELSDADFKHFGTQRAAALGLTTNKLEEVSMSALNTALADRMRSQGMDPTPKDETPEAVRLGVVKKTLIDTALAWQKQTGKPMTDADMEKHVDSMYAKSATFRSSFLGISGGVTSQRLLTMKASDIPDDTLAALKKDFKAAGVTDPTDGDLLGAYFKLKTMSARPKPAPRPAVPPSKLEADTRAFMQGLSENEIDRMANQ